jgi:hypothetical protein
MRKNQTESYHSFQGNTIPWIEKLLHTPIDDYRNNAVSLILAPWLSKCGELRQLDQNFDYTVRYALKYSAKNGNRPLKLNTLKLKNTALYGVES